MKQLFAILAVLGVVLYGLMAYVDKKPAPPLANSFNVPSLVGKNVDGVMAALGDPEFDLETKPTEANKNPGMMACAEWDKEWKRGNISLLVTYNRKTRTVVDFFIATDSSTGATADKGRLLGLAQSDETAAGYVVDFVPAMGHRGEFTGIKIVPQ